MKNLLVAAVAAVSVLLTGCDHTQTRSYSVPTGLYTTRLGYMHKGDVEQNGIDSCGRPVQLGNTKWNLEGYQDVAISPGGYYGGGTVAVANPPPIAHQGFVPARQVPPPGHRSYEYIPPGAHMGSYIPPATSGYYPATTTPYAPVQQVPGVYPKTYTR